MAHTNFPDLEGNDEECDADKWRGVVQYHGRAEWVGPIEQGQTWEITDTGQGHNIGEEFAKPRFVNGQGILGRLNTAIGEGVHEFEAFGGPKGDGGLNDHEGKKETGASDDGGDAQCDFFG